MASLLGSVERDDDFVALARADLVVAARTPVGLVGLVRLHVPDIDRRVVAGVVRVGPVVLGHWFRRTNQKDRIVTTPTRSCQARCRHADARSDGKYWSPPTYVNDSGTRSEPCIAR